MKEQLQGKLVEILTGIQGAVGKASDFAMEQLPDIAMQYIYFSISAYCLGMITFGIASYVLYRVTKKLYEEDEDSCVLTGMFFIGSSAIALNNLHMLLMVLLAPKVYLLKEIAGMIK
jgi:hypothetical protein